MSKFRRSYAWIIVPVSLLSVGGYLAWSYSQGLTGFPLDDAWIHQTYARNLAQTGQLAYLPGQPSAGSTSPAWSFLLSVGYLLGVDYRIWAYLLGALSHAATALLVYRLTRRLAPTKPKVALFAGLLCALEWHLVWSAASGMETPLFTALSLALLEYFFTQVAVRSSSDGPASLRTEQIIVNSVGIGLLSGALVLTRPEGLVLAGFVVLGLVALPLPLQRREVPGRLLAMAVSLLGLGLLLAPYVAFNMRTSGSIFPSTFYAKQIEYQITRSLPSRFLWVAMPTLVGAQVLLLPGFFYGAYHLIRSRQWPATLPVLWWLALLSLYAWRLPVNYQHGRYVIPTIPVLIGYGIWGTHLLLRPNAPQTWKRVVSRATPLAVALVAGLFWLRGAQAYVNDVGVIEGEMVSIARWIDAHTAPTDVIAVHDIGAVGYLSDRPLLDLAGLLSPEVTAFMSDPEMLAAWMIDHEASYAVFFPDFSPAYAQLAADPRFQQEYCTGHAWTLAAGRENMCVYRLVDGEEPKEL
jgi:hypothetical protein